MTCPDCKGKGEYVGLITVEKCATCKGSGSLIEDLPLRVPLGPTKLTYEYDAMVDPGEAVVDMDGCSRLGGDITIDKEELEKAMESWRGRILWRGISIPAGWFEK